MNYAIKLENSDTVSARTSPSNLHEKQYQQQQEDLNDVSLSSINFEDISSIF